MNNLEYVLDEFEMGNFPEMDVIALQGNQGEPNILFYSSMLFITNALFAFRKQYYVYSFLFGLLTTSSLMYHWPSDNVIIGHFDKICIVSIVSYGGHMFYNKTKSRDDVINDIVDESETKTNGLNMKRILCAGTVVGFFCMTLYFYIYGYAIEDYCFHKQKHVGDIYHSLIHLASSIGHHLIMFM